MINIYIGGAVADCVHFFLENVAETQIAGGIALITQLVLRHHTTGSKTAHIALITQLVLRQPVIVMASIRLHAPFKTISS